MKKFRLGFIIVSIVALMVFTACSGGEESASVNTSETRSVSSSDVNYPTKTINITVPYDAGSSTDIRARYLAQILGEKLGVTVTVTNLAGAAGSIGTIDYIMKNADPHEILIAGIAAVTTAPLTNSALPYTFDDFKVIAALDQEEQILYTCPQQSGISSFEQLIETGKTRTIKYGGGGPTAANDIIQAAAYKQAGIQYESIVTSSTSQRILDVLGGTVDVTCAPPSSGAEFVASGELVPIAVLSPEPYSGFEGLTVPTLNSFGYENFVFNAYNIILMNGDVDQTYVDFLTEAIHEIYETEGYQEKAEDLGMNICYDSPEQVKKNVDSTISAFSEMLQFINN